MATAIGITAADYLTAERASQTKSEWIDGEVREMVGASRRHSLIVGNIYSRLRFQLDERHETHFVEVRVRIPDGPYYYPDVVVVPRPPQMEDSTNDTLLNPVVIFEVLSPSTESIDRREKLDNYRRIPTLTDYVLVAQDEPRVERFELTVDAKLQLEIKTEGVLALPSLDVELPLDDIYSGIELG